jgi:predicted ATPase/DNA-binding SARP family transcriptional activator
VEICVLGPLTVSGGDGPGPLGQTQRRLLAFLAARADRVVTLDEIGDVLGLATAGAVRTAVSRLRRIVGDALSRVPPGYLLEGHCLDASRFDELVRQASGLEPSAKAAQLGEALAMWRGAAFVEFADEPWARGVATRLDELRWSAQEERIETLLALGSWAEASADAHRVTVEQPLRERARAQQMRALALQGRTTEALRVYHDFHRYLSEEIGVAPSAELAALERQILSGDIGTPTAPALGANPPAAGRTNLPVADALIGREAEVALVGDLVRSHPLVTITGPGGVGKSRLALAVGHDARAIQDGVWLVELAPIDAPPSVIGAVAAAIPMPAMPTSTADLVGQIGSRQMLVILDNCEHLVGEVALLVTQLLRACPGLHLLCTSQEALAVDREQVVVLSPLNEEPATTLFDERARAVRFDFTSDPAAVGTIVRRLDGLPLAIELAAARVSTFSVGEIAAGLDDRFSLLSDGRRDQPARHRGLAAMVEWGYEVLDPSERTLFRRLGIFPGSFTRDAAADITARRTPAGTRTDELDRLVRRSLVVADTSGPTARFRLLETLRHYAAARLRDAAETDAIGRRHAEWYADFALAFERIDSPDETLWLTRAIDEFDNLRVAVAFAVDHRDTDLAVRLVGRLWRLNVLWRAELLDWARQVLTLPGAADHPDIGYVYLVVGTLAWITGDLAASERACDDALRRTLDKSAWIAASLFKGNMMSYTGRFEEREPIYAAAADRATTAYDRIWVVGLSIASVTYSGKPGPAIDEDRYIAEADASDIPWARSFARMTVALSMLPRGQADEAKRLLYEALVIAEPGLNRRSVNIINEVLGLAAAGHSSAASGEPADDLVESAARALALGAEYPLGMGFALVGLTVLADRLGRSDDAALLAGYMLAHLEPLALPAASAAHMAGGPLERFARPETRASFDRGQKMSAATLRTELERLAAPAEA